MRFGATPPPKAKADVCVPAPLKAFLIVFIVAGKVDQVEPLNDSVAVDFVASVGVLKEVAPPKYKAAV